MRKIKFRIWHKKENRWLDPWAEEDPILSLADYGRGCEVFLYDRKSKEHSNIDCQMDDVVIQQYTGLKDRNGREIYEGDILSFPKDSMEDYIVHAIVRYGTGQFDGGVYKYTGFYLESTGDDVNLKEGDIMEPYEITNLHDPKWHHYEVVGNIFEGVDK